MRFGRDLDLAQFAAQSRDVFGQLDQRGLQRVHFGLHARARDRDFARLVDELFKRIGAHAHHRVDFCLVARQCGLGPLGGRGDCRHGVFLRRLRMRHPFEQQAHAIVGSLQFVEELSRREFERDRVLDARLHVVG